MRVLITCPRAPVTIEWIRIFNRAGHEVILVDSLTMPIAKYYKKTKFIEVASPRLNFEQYKKEMLKLIAKVDWVIPNCEDIFYLSQIRESIKGDAFLFMPESSLLFGLHHKFTVSNYLNNHVVFPKSRVLESKEQIVMDENKILKPIFSRFGKSVIRNISQKEIEKIEVSPKFPWLEQERIEGKAFCNYALLLEGKVLAHVAYEPQYLLNGAAATYFEPYDDERLVAFIEQFAKETNYNGQVAFDFIDNGENLCLLECNPRATSGLHLLSENLEFREGEFVYQERVKPSAQRVGSTLYLLFGFKALFNGEWKKLNHDHKRAKDVLEGLPWYAQFLSMFGMLKRAVVYRKDVTSASTFDIEFDG